MSTSDSVFEILTSEGHYKPLPKPFKVGSQSFEFTHAFVASERANDIVIVIELRGDTADDAIVRKVHALTRALDVLRSKRPVTAVLTVGQPRTETVQSISRVCRVLPVGSPDGPQARAAVRDWLSVLLPLAEAPAVESMLDWEADLRNAVNKSARGPLMDRLLVVAPRGEQAVEAALTDAINTSIRPVLDAANKA